MIYLASPFSHADPAIRQWRYEKACVLTVKLLQRGQHVFSPIAYSYGLAEQFGLCGSWAFWEKLDLDFIDRCDELLVYKLPAWEQSVGVTAEIRLCHGARQACTLLGRHGGPRMSRLPRIAIGAARHAWSNDQKN